ncbi:MAG: ATP-binding cassette domain-containing protein [Lachnospiraceae bacterium]|nr:ATP-binding cassette domain-containing protein [Lachnospiraceae bacterium]
MENNRGIINEDNIILRVSHLNSYYKEKTDRFGSVSVRKQILKDVSFDIEKGKIVGLVGESGCGKSTLAKTILGIVKDYDGTVEKKCEGIQMVFQDPYGSLNPAKTIGWILEEPLRIRGELKDPERNRRVSEMIRKVGLDDSYLVRKPGELSGGQRQRICIALALMMEPKLIIADEPVSALDVTVQDQILKLLLKLNKELGVAILFISHDLKVVYSVCSRVMVMKDGEIIEQGTDEEVYKDPKHPYTKQLLSSVLMD